MIFHADTLCLDVPEGYNECEAEFSIDEIHGCATLLNAKLGGLQISRAMVVQIAGEESIAQHERAAFERWTEQEAEWGTLYDRTMEAAE